jgi:hypothetical protein
MRRRNDQSVCAQQLLGIDGHLAATGQRDEPGLIRRLGGEGQIDLCFLCWMEQLYNAIRRGDPRAEC